MRAQVKAQEGMKTVTTGTMRQSVLDSGSQRAPIIPKHTCSPSKREHIQCSAGYRPSQCRTAPLGAQKMRDPWLCSLLPPVVGRG